MTENSLQNNENQSDEKDYDAFLEKPLRPGMARPVIIHRAILGSLERMCAVLLEHTAGKLPFWLSPRQAIVLSISEKSNHYAYWVKDNIQKFGYDVDIDDSNNTISKKVRDAQLNQWNYMLVVGEQESTNETVTVRIRENPKHQKEMPIEDLLRMFDANMPNSREFNKISPYKPKRETTSSNGTG